MSKISYLLFLLIMIFACSESRNNYISEGETLLMTAENNEAKIEEAIELFKKELEINPGSKAATKNLAAAYSHISKNDSAIIVLSRVIVENKNELAEFFQMRGMINFIMKNYDASIEDFENSLKYRGGNKLVYNQIVFAKLEKKYKKDGKWMEFSEEDISKIIDAIYPENLEKPTVDEFKQGH